MLKPNHFDYELLDCGNFRRIERFGKYILNRPCPQAPWKLKMPEGSIKSDFYFVRSKKKKFWEMRNKNFEKLPECWNIHIGAKQAQLKFSSNNQVGIFPEQFDNWQWIDQKITEKLEKNPKRNFKILNTFAYTGMSTLFSSAKNTEVCHVDGAKSAINWAKRNTHISEMEENKIRWIIDDVMKFMAREIKRGNKYDAIILDPPAFGRGAKSEWHIEKDLPKLMKLVSKLLTPKPLFVILTCHAPDFFSKKDFARILESLPQFRRKRAQELELKIPSKRGNALPSSFGARICQ